VLKQLEAGRTAVELARETGVSKHTIYAWKSQFGGMEVGEAEELRSLRDENQRLKKLVADLKPGQRDAEVADLKKRLQLAGVRAQREVGREDASHLMATFHTSVRRACELAQIARSTYRFERDTQRDEPLGLRLIELAQDKPRYGYRRLWVLLRWEGTVVNHKRLFRI
jgi:putative transposase